MKYILSLIFQLVLFLVLWINAGYAHIDSHFPLLTSHHNTGFSALFVSIGNPKKNLNVDKSPHETVTLTARRSAGRKLRLRYRRK